MLHTISWTQQLGFYGKNIDNCKMSNKIIKVGNTGGLLPSFIAGPQDKLIGVIQLLAGFRTDP